MKERFVEFVQSFFPLTVCNINYIPFDSKGLNIQVKAKTALKSISEIDYYDSFFIALTLLKSLTYVWVLFRPNKCI